MDLGYPDAIIADVRTWLADRANARIITLGSMIPMQALDQVRADIRSDYTLWLDNDSRVTAQWLPPLLETADHTQAAIVYPLTLEAAGVDEGADLRNHLFTTELRVVDVDNKPYLIEYKTHRRALPDSLPREICESQAFEFHCVMWRTTELQQLEIPYMTIREHLDIGMQLRARGQKILVDPRSIVVFDNLGTRAHWADLRYFNLRWNAQVTWQSSRLFEQRWGYNFYSEQSIYNWAMRRRLFLLMRWLYLPSTLANKLDRLLFALRRRIWPIWDPLPNAQEQATLLYDRCPQRRPTQKQHHTQFATDLSEP